MTGPGFFYLLVVDKLLANLAGVDPIQAAAAFGRPAVVVRLQAVVDETPLNPCVEKGFIPSLDLNQVQRRCLTVISGPSHSCWYWDQQDSITMFARPEFEV